MKTYVVSELAIWMSDKFGYSEVFDLDNDVVGPLIILPPVSSVEILARDGGYFMVEWGPSHET